jgi:hypothetical protein
MVAVHTSRNDEPDFSRYMRASYESVLQAIDIRAALTLDFGAARLAHAVRRAADRQADPLAPGKVAEKWLRANLGFVDDSVRRAAVAALALGLKPDALSLPGDMLALYPAMHARMVRFLEGARRYDADVFAKDIALAAGAAVPGGALSIATPSPEAPRLSAGRLRRAVTGAYRQAQGHGVREALHWAAEWGVGSWAELHIDTRNLGEFNPAGLERCYHRLAALMALRPDLVGVYGASWLYQPELAEISPNLAFVRLGPERGGGRVVRLRADPVQTAYAIARSPTRRALHESGRYDPVCYGMFWPREALMAWSRAELAKAAPTVQPGRRRTPALVRSDRS